YTVKPFNAEIIKRKVVKLMTRDSGTGSVQTPVSTFDASKSKIAQGNLKGLKALVVDDQTVMRRTIKHILRQVGNCQDVKEAEDGDTALALLQGERKPFDLIICDWNMPRMKGIDLLKIIREDDSLKDIPFLLVTGEMDEATVAEAAETNVDAYILKPFGPKTLMEKVIQILIQKRKPSPLDTHLQLAMVHLQALDLDKAMEEIQKARSISPSSPRSYYAGGLVLEAKKEYRKAEKVYLKAVELSPKFVRAHERLSSIYIPLGEPDKAIAHLKKTIEISPRNVERQIELGERLLDKGDAEEARRIFKDAQRQTTDESAQMSKRIGDIFLKNGWFEEALSAYENSIGLHPGDAYVQNRMGIAYRKLKNWDKALDCYRKSLEMTPDDENIHYNIGRTYLEQGQKFKALEHFRKALQIYPEFAEAAAMVERIEQGQPIE
ncbi:MAG: tetratricopeptide repeat protein, partial [Deltaproteobacteria bacterium]|nr:tetratricopeptide repeat protein [Deltaproteobacteria bacterium]